jgi:hypothetical protein
MAQAFEMCAVRDWNLSYSCLTSYAARSKLRGLRESDPEFWDELTSKKLGERVPPEDMPQPEDTLPTPDNDGSLDDSDVPVHSVINNIIHKKVPKGYAILPDGGIEANAEAERFGDADETVVNESIDGVDKDLGRGKRKRKPNTRYNTSTFWRHDDSDGEILG